MIKLTLSMQFVSCVALTMTVTVIGVMVFQFLYISSVIDKWKDMSTGMITNTEIQRLHNFVYSNKLIIENQIKGISLGFHSMNALYLKFQHDVVDYSSLFTPLECSMRLYDQKLCEQIKYDLQTQNFMYLDQWFHVNIYQISQLSDAQRAQLMRSIRVFFFAKSFSVMKRNDLIDVQLYSTTFPDSMMLITPSRLKNYASSARETCNGSNNLEPFDPRCRSWYTQALAEKKLIFTAPFLAVSTYLIGFSATQRNDDTDGTFLSMFSANLGLQNMKTKIFAQQDILEETRSDEGYTVLAHTASHNVYHHRYWKPEDRVLKIWTDIEYNSTFPVNQKDKDDFQANYYRVSNLSLLSNYSIVNCVNISQFFFRFNRLNQSYYALMYPVEAMTVKNSGSREVEYSKTMLIGRVSKDQTHVIEDVTLKYIPVISSLVKGEVAFIVLWLLINILHLFAVLFYSHDQPLQNLITVLRENANSIKNSEKNAREVRLFQREREPTFQKECGSHSIMPKLQLNVKALDNFLMSDIKTPNDLNHSTMQGGEKQVLFQSNKLENNKISLNLLDCYSKQDGKQVSSGETKANFSSILQKQLSVDMKQSFLPLLDESNAQGPQSPNHNLSPILTKKRMSIFSARSPERTRSWKGSSINNNSSNREIKATSVASISFSATEDQESILRERQQSFDYQNKNLSETPQTFQELKDIIDSIHGIFHLLQLAKIDSETGHRDSSVLQLSKAARIFQKVRNFSQLVICHKGIGLLYLKDQMFVDAAKSFQKALYAIFKEVGFIEMGDEMDLIKKGQINISEKENLQESAKLMRLIAIAFMEKSKQQQKKRKDHVSQKSKQLLLQAKKSIDKSIEILSLLKDDCGDINLLISLFVKAELIQLTSAIDETIHSCDNLSNLIFNTQNQYTKSRVEQSDEVTIQILTQEVQLLKANMLVQSGKTYEGSLQIVEQLFQSQFLDEGVKFASLNMLKEISSNYLSSESSDFLGEELQKYQKSHLKISFIFELDSILPMSLLEHQIKCCSSIIQNCLQDEDSVEFWRIINGDLDQVCPEYEQSDHNFSLFCFEDIKRQFHEYSCSSLQKTDMDDQRRNSMNCVEEILKLKVLKDKKLPSSSQVKSHSIIIIFSPFTGDSQASQSTKQQWSSIVKNYPSFQQKIHILQYNQFSSPRHFTQADSQCSPIAFQTNPQRGIIGIPRDQSNTIHSILIKKNMSPKSNETSSPFSGLRLQKFQEKSMVFFEDQDQKEQQQCDLVENILSCEEFFKVVVSLDQLMKFIQGFRYSQPMIKQIYFQ